MFKIHPAIHPKIHLKIQEIGSESGCGSCHLRGFLANFPTFQDANFLASWLQILIFEFSRILEFSLWFWSLRRERNSLARSSLVRALLFPLCPLCSTLPGSRLER